MILKGLIYILPRDLPRDYFQNPEINIQQLQGTNISKFSFGDIRANLAWKE